MSAPNNVIGKVICLNIKHLLSIDKKYLEENLKHGGHIMFDDGNISYYNKNEIILLRYIMEPIVRMDLIQELNLTSKVDIKKYYSNNRYTGKTINNLVAILSEIIVKDFIRPRRGNDVIPADYVIDRTIIDYTLDKPKLDKTLKPSKEVLVLFYKYCYEMLQDIWSNVVFEHLEHVTGLDIRDFLELQFEPELINAIEEATIKQDVESIENSYVVLDKVMKMAKYKDNPIAIGYNSGTMNPAQLRQMLGCRGFVTEINGQLFKRPVTSNFILGMADIYEFAIESRSGAKALYFTVVGVEKSEYMARGIQLVATILERTVEGDCGSTEYEEWYIRAPEEHSGSDDLRNMQGMYYLNEKTNKLDIISEDSKHLYGKVIKIRHINKCKLKNSRHVCHTCLGEMSYSFFRHNNIGFFGTTIGTSECTQKIISTKHLTMSAKATILTVSKEVAKYVLARKNSYYMRANVSLGNGTHKLIVEQNEIIGLKSLNNMDITNVNPIRLSRLKSVYIEVNNRSTNEIVELKLRQKSSYGVFTKEFLKYMQGRWILDNLDRVVIDLSDWDKSKPIIYTPEIEYSYLDLAILVKKMFNKMEPGETPIGFLQKLFDVINSKLSVNLSILSAMAYGFTVRDLEKKDYRLGRHSKFTTIRPLDEIILNRSLGASYGWEELNKNLFNPAVYYGNNNVATPLDVIITLDNKLE